MVKGRNDMTAMGGLFVVGDEVGVEGGPVECDAVAGGFARGVLAVFGH